MNLLSVHLSRKDITELIKKGISYLNEYQTFSTSVLVKYYGKPATRTLHLKMTPYYKFHSKTCDSKEIHAGKIYWTPTLPIKSN